MAPQPLKEEHPDQFQKSVQTHQSRHETVSRILIVGASGRAAAASARRADFEPFVLDLFADADTERLATVFKLPMADYPHGFIELARRLPSMPWMYTGGIENYPDVVAAISETHELLGNGPDVLRKVRDPIALQEWMRQFKRTKPRTVLPGEIPAPDGRWLRKPLRGSAGHGVRFATPEDFAKQTDQNDYYLQEFLTGQSLSAVFAHGRKGWPTFVGLSRQLIGTPWLHARPFAYAGSIMIDTNTNPDVRPTGGWITHHFPLKSVWGIDFIQDEKELCVVEVNPRYTASVEIYELASETASLTQQEPAVPKRTIGKAIYYAPHRITFPSSGPWDDSLAKCADVWRVPEYADIPHTGDIIEKGHPVLTFFAVAANEAECESKLMKLASELDQFFSTH